MPAWIVSCVSVLPETLPLPSLNASWMVPPSGPLSDSVCTSSTRVIGIRAGTELNEGVSVPPSVPPSVSVWVSAVPILTGRAGLAATPLNEAVKLPCRAEAERLHFAAAAVVGHAGDGVDRGGHAAGDEARRAGRL